MVLKSVGLMSGTSMDGIDAVLMETDGEKIIKSIATESIIYDPKFKLLLRDSELAVRKAKKNVASFEVVKESTELHAKVVKALLEKVKLLPKDIDVIGYHGQALYHNPSEGITIQIGDGQLLSNLTGIKVVNDFRSDDIRNGGQGAPLAPLYHQALAMRDSYFPVAVVNCGGISNISIINGGNESQVIGFDTGPGNVLIDRYIRKKTNNLEFMDLDGRYGSEGIVNQKILDKMLGLIKPYLEKKSPKSLDPGSFNLIKELDEVNISDACATLEALTARCIVDSVDVNAPKKWILAGGGWNNPVILKFLKEYLSEKLGSVDINLASDIGWDNAYMEAEIFAYLAVRKLYNLPITIPNVTGATVASYGGTIYAC